MPILGSGHPQADILLLKYAPTASEIEEGVAFYGRSGTALMKSLKRLEIDPLAVYGTLCVKCPVADTSLAAPECVARLVEEIAIVQPRIVVVMGPEALETLNELALPLASEVAAGRRRDPGADAVDRGALRAEHRPARSTRSRPSARSGPRSAASATGTRTSRRTEAPRIVGAL